MVHSCARAQSIRCEVVLVLNRPGAQFHSCVIESCSVGGALLTPCWILSCPLSRKTACAIIPVLTCICAWLNRAESLVHNRFGAQMTGAQFSLRTLCSGRMVHNSICVQLNRAQSVVHNRRGVRLVGAQLYPRVACPVDMVYSNSRAQSVRAQLVVLNRYRAQSYGAQSVPSRWLYDYHCSILNFTE